MTRHLLMVFGFLGLASCAASPPAVVDTADQAADRRRLMHDFLKCAIQHEPEIDDKLSDASTIALALTNRCLPEYTAVTESQAFGRDRRLKAMWEQRRDTREEKVEASLEVVLEVRRGAVANPNF